MRLALLSDAHGNPTALRACLAAVASIGADALYFLGDAVGYLDGAPEVLDLLHAAGAHCQQGNHEAMLLGALPLDDTRDRIYRLAHARTQLSASQRAWIATWPTHRQLELDGVSILLAHGSPAPSLTEYLSDNSPVVLPPNFPYQAAFVGHTHFPFVQDVNGVCVANVGSCGLPRDRGDLASFCLFDTGTRSARIIRVPFDRDSVLATHGQACAREVRDVLFRERQAYGELVSVA